MEKQQPLVSIITPCFNGERFVHRFLDSILGQTYKNIELIFVNDGSTDATEEIVLSYREKFQNAGMQLKYFKQENKGLAEAINAGLKIFSGEYLCWPDSDDFLAVDSVEMRLSFLEEHLEYGAVTSDANIFDENDLSTPIGRIAKGYPHSLEENQFEYLLSEQSIFCPGCHMVRSKMFLDVNPQRQIYPARRGQNFQMLLPVYYKYKRKFIEKPLYNYVVYKNSMSRGDNTSEAALFRCNEHETIVINTLDVMQMPSEERERYIKFTKVRYAKKRLRMACLFHDVEKMREEYLEMKQNHWASLRDTLFFYVGKQKVGYVCIQMYRKIKQMLARY